MCGIFVPDSCNSQTKNGRDLLVTIFAFTDMAVQEAMVGCMAVGTLGVRSHWRCDAYNWNCKNLGWSWEKQNPILKLRGQTGRFGVKQEGLGSNLKIWGQTGKFGVKLESFGVKYIIN